MERDYPGEAKIFKAFCDEKRLRILDLLLGGEKCVCALYEELGLPQSTLSYHMRILVDSRAIIPRQEGKWTHYSISKEGVLCAVEILKGFALLKSKQQKNRDCCVSG